MATHSLSATHIWVHENRRLDNLVPLDALGPHEEDLLHLCRAALHKYAYANDRKNRYLNVEGTHPQGRSFVMEAHGGRYREPGVTVNVRTHTVEHTRSGDSSSTVPVRVVFLIPENSLHGLIFFEHVGRSSVGGEVLDAMSLAFRQRFGPHGLSLKTETLLEDDAWLADSELEEAKAVVYKWSEDFADGEPRRLRAKRTVVLEPREGESIFSPWVWQALQTGSISRAKLFGLEEQEDIDEVRVRAVGHGRPKSFVLGRERTPSVRYLLADEGAPVPKRAEVLTAAIEHAVDLFAGVGGEWKAGAHHGAWTRAQMQVEMKVPDRE